MSDMNNPSDENTGALDDLWADALNEQKATTTKSAADAVFQQLGGGDVSGAGYLIAQGEVVVVADKYGVRITDIITPSERMRRLSR